MDLEMEGQVMKSLVLCTLAVALVLAGSAGADEIYLPDNQPGVGASNVIPMGGVWPSSNTNGEYTYQWFIPAAILGGKPFRLTGIANAPVYSGVHTAAQAEILVSHNSLASYSTVFAQNLPQPSTLYPLGPWTWTVTANQWEPFNLPTTAGFDYNGTDNLTIQIRFYGSMCSLQGSTYLGCRNQTSTNSASRVYLYGVGAFTATSGRASTNYSNKLRLTVSYISIIGSGTPRPGGQVDLLLSAPGDGGLPYQVGSSLGTGPIPIGSRQLHLSPDPLLIATVNGWLPSIFQNYAGILDKQGQGKATILIPNDTGLIGVTLHSAFVTIKLGEPQNVKSVSPTYSFQVTK